MADHYIGPERLGRQSAALLPRHRRRRAPLLGAVLVIIILATSFLSGPCPTVRAHEAHSDYKVKPISLPGANGPIVLDHLICDRTRGKLWVPGSNAGKVYVIDENSDAVLEISEFKTREVELEGQRVIMGPTAISRGPDVVYIGNRADRTVCSINADTLERGRCVDLTRGLQINDGGPHSLAYIASTKELWVTTGPAKSIQVFDASSQGQLNWKTEILLESACEGGVVDNSRARFYTNLGEIGQTIAIDVRSRKPVARWNVGSHDLQGLALDTSRNFLFVACGDHVVSLDAGHTNKVIDSTATGAGLDDIDYSAKENVLYAAASVTATLAMLEVDNEARFQLKALVPTVKGARGVTAANGRTAYVIDPAGGRILKVTPKS